MLEMFFFNNAKETLEDNLKMIDKLGGVETCNHYAWGRTNAGNTPFRRWKRETYRGGTTDPCIVSWPKGIQARGELRSQYAHIIDFVPTVLEALGTEAPESIRGVTQAPIDGSAFERINVERPTIAKPRNKYVYYQGGSGVPSTATPKVYNRPWSITAEAVIPKGGAEGVLMAQGGRAGGYTFFVKDQKLHFLHNWLGRDKFWVHSNETIPEGKVELRYEFEPTGKPDPAQGHGMPARGQLYINRKLVGSVDMPYSILIIFGT